MADASKSNDVLQLSIERKRKAVKSADEESRLEALFRALGGDGKIRVHRRLPGATGYSYLDTLDASDTVCDELEETLCQMFGGGDFKIIGRQKGVDLGSAYVSIDVRQHPPRTVAADGAQGATSASDAKVSELMQIVRDQQQRIERLAEQRTGDLQAFAQMQLGMMREMGAERQQAATQQLQLVITAMQGRAPAQAPDDPLKKAREVVGFAKELKELSGDGGAGSDNRSMVERVLEAPLTAAGTRIVDKFFAEEAKPAPQAQAAPKPAAQLPAAQPTPPAAPATPPAAPVASSPAPTPPPRSAGAARMPAGFTPLSREQLQAARERARANAGGTSTPSTSPAPDVRQVRPESR